MRNILIVAALAGAGYGGYQWQAGGDGAPAAEAMHDAKLVKDRVWIDHIPRSETEKVNVFIALTKNPSGRGGPIGIFEEVSAWEGHFLAFKHESHGNEMRVVFPQTAERETLLVEATKCDQGGMDYCLDIAGSKHGVKRYYSRKGWEIRDLDDAQAITSALAR